MSTRSPDVSGRPDDEDRATIAAALLRDGIASWRMTRKRGERRGVFCGIGHCFDCLVDIGDRHGVRACQERPRSGDEVREFRLREEIPDAPPEDSPPPQARRVDGDVAVVGAGPGGMAAALAAADAGCRVVLIDSSTRPGGQIYRQADGGQGDGRRGGGVLPARFDRIMSHPRVTFLSGITIWHAGQDQDRFVLHGTAQTAIRAAAVVLATGASEFVLPFPGWTLPAVVTAGAAQALLKAHGTLPGRRVLVAGTGPLLLRAAADLVRHGATVVAVCELATASRLLAAAPALARHPRKVAEGAGYAATLVRARVPVLRGWTIAACEGGQGRVRSARVTNGKKSRTFDVDAVAVSHGLVPSLELARALACRDEQLRTFPAAAVVVDEDQRTTRPGIFACGEITGVGGADKAEAEGTVAGLSAARHAGKQRQQSEEGNRDILATARRKVRRAHGFAVMLGRLYPVDGAALAPGETVICRCEEVTMEEVAAAVAAGAADLRAVKGLTRCGMGYCQGRICGPYAQLAVARLSGRPLAAVGDLHTRHIGIPVTLGELSNARSAWPA